MGRVKPVRVSAKDPEALSEAINSLVAAVNGALDFGDPIDPNDDQSVALAGSSHNGTPSNLRGSWVELEFTALDTEVVATHNLDIAITNSEVNVRWFLAGLRHSGTGVASGANEIVILRQDGDALTENTLGLRAYASGLRTINGANPIRASFYFIPSTRWPD